MAVEKVIWLSTTWPVVTEVLQTLDFNINVQINFLEWIKRGGLNIKQITVEDIPRIIELSRKYSDIPMDFTDAS